jgi:YihY family inner membrane protein
VIARWLAAIDAWQRRRPSTAFPFAVVKKFGDDHAGHLAALVAYYSFFSIFPLLLVLTTILGRVLESRPDLRDDLLDSALAQFPVIGDQLRDSTGSIPGSGLALVIGIVGAIWGGMGAMMAMQNALNGVWNVPYTERPNMVKGRVRALVMLGLFGLGIVGLTAASSVAGLVGDIGVLGDVTSLAVAFALGVGLFLCAFRVLTDAPTTWGDVLPGAVAAALAWSVLQVLGGAFVQHVVANASSTAGVFAVVIGLLSWLYLVAQLTVLSAEINVVRREGLWPRSMTGRDLGEGDKRALARYAAAERRVEGQEVVIDLRPPAVQHWVRTSSTGRTDDES